VAAEREDAAVVAVIDDLERVVIAAPHLLDKSLVPESKQSLARSREK
jgi:hypothetical protein